MSKQQGKYYGKEFSFGTPPKEPKHKVSTTSIAKNPSYGIVSIAIWSDESYIVDLRVTYSNGIENDPNFKGISIFPQQVNEAYSQYRLNYVETKNDINFISVKFNKFLSSIKFYSDAYSRTDPFFSVECNGGANVSEEVFPEREGKTLSVLKYLKWTCTEYVDSVIFFFPSTNNLMVQSNKYLSKEIEKVKDVVTKSRFSLQRLENNTKSTIMTSINFEELINATPRTNTIKNDQSKKKFEEFLSHLQDVRSEHENLVAQFRKIQNLVTEADLYYHNVFTEIQPILKLPNFKYDPKMFTTQQKQLKGLLERILSLKNNNLNAIQDKFQKLLDNTSARKIEAQTESKEVISVYFTYEENDSKLVENLRKVKDSLAQKKGEKDQYTNQMNLLENYLKEFQAMDELLLKKEASLNEKCNEMKTKNLEKLSKLSSNGMTQEELNSQLKEIQQKYKTMSTTSREHSEKKCEDLLNKIQKLRLHENLDPTEILLHLILILDESGSMQSYWQDLVCCYNNFIQLRKDQNAKDLVSLILFDDSARTYYKKEELNNVQRLPDNPRGGYTDYGTAIREAETIINSTNSPYEPVIIFFTDGSASYNSACSSLTGIKSKQRKLRFFGIGFGSADLTALREMSIVTNGSSFFSVDKENFDYVYSANDVHSLNDVFDTVCNLVDGKAARILSQIKFLTGQISEERNLLTYLEKERNESLIQEVDALKKFSDSLIQSPEQTEQLVEKLSAFTSIYTDEIKEVQKRRAELLKKINKIIEEINKKKIEIDKAEMEIGLLEEKQEQEQKRVNEANEFIDSIQTKKKENIERIIGDTGFLDQKSMVSFIDRFKSRAEAIKNSLELVNSAIDFISQLEIQVSSLLLALTGKRDITNTITDLLGEICQYWGETLGIPISNGKDHDNIGEICFALNKYFKKDEWKKDCANLSTEQLMNLTEIDDDDVDDDVMEIVESILGEEEDDDDKGEEDDFKKNIEDVKKARKLTTDKEEKKKLQEKIKSLKEKEKKEKSKKKMEAKEKKLKPKIILDVLKQVRNMLKKGKAAVLNYFTKPFLIVSFQLCASAIPMALEYAKTSVSLTNSETNPETNSETNSQNLLKSD